MNTEMADKPPDTAPLRRQPKRIRSEEQKLKKKGYDLARAKSRVNIGMGFQRWRNLRELKCIKTDEDLAMFLLDSFDQNSLSPGITLGFQSFIPAAVPAPAPVPPVAPVKNEDELNHSNADEVVVKLECLLQLFQKCLVCCSECSISTERDGWFFYVTQKCQQCHYSREWASHPTDQIISDPAENHEVSSSESGSACSVDSMEYSSEQEAGADQGAMFTGNHRMGLGSDSEYVSSLDQELPTEQRVGVNQGAIFNIREILSKATNGGYLLSSLDENCLISHPERRRMVRILVSHLMERFGEHPTSGTKALLASSVVEQFPCLRDCQGSGYDAWFTPGRNHKPATGFLEERLRNVRKRLHRGQRGNSATQAAQQETLYTLPDVCTPAPQFTITQDISLEDISTFDIRKILNKTPSGKYLVTCLEENGLISHTERKRMVRILVSHLMEIFGENPSTGTKALLASSIVDQFPRLRDCQGSGYDAWFTPGRNHKPATGFLEERLRNVRKRLHRGQRGNSATQASQQEGPYTLPATPAPTPVFAIRQDISMEKIDTFDIRKILNKTPDGRYLVTSLDENGFISDTERRLMVRILVSHLMENFGENPNSGTKALLASSIVDQFPCLRDPQGSGYDAWFTPGRNHKPATGFLEERLRNVRKRLHRGQKRNSAAQESQQGTQDALPESTITPERAIQLAEWLRKNKWPPSQVAEFMLETAIYRARWIRAHKSSPIHDFIAEFPRLVDTPGMISQDFSVLYPEASGRLTGTWNLVFSEKIICMAKTERTDSILTGIDMLPPDKRGDIALQLLPALLPPAPYRVGKEALRHSSLECQKAFIDTQPFGTILADYLSVSTAEYPYVLLLGQGHDCAQAFTIINGTAMEHPSLLSAVDACFKAFFVFQLEYPKPCTQIWEFIQTVVFGIPGYESNRVKLMRAQLFAR